MEIRTRVAPSPTGYVHIGTLYNALFAHALAKSEGGKFILRIEDTDQKREIIGANDELYEVLDIFNLAPDEGPLQGGPYAPYIQSERVTTGVYMDAAKKLIESGNAYYCFTTPEELQKFREENEKKKIRSVFRSTYRDLPVSAALKRIANGEKFVIRLKVPENEILEIDDAILGKISWNSSEIDDQVLIKSDGFPTYHLAVVVDDHDMKITHVTRGFDWIPSTPKQILLYKYLGYDLPVFAHNGLILDPKGGKLSKRKGNVSVKQFLVEGYLVEAMINFMMLIGWSPDMERAHGEKERELFSHEEFIQMYKLKDRRKTSGIFDREKLIWFNQQYIMSKNTSDLRTLFINWITKYKEEEFVIQLQTDSLIEEINTKGDDYLESILELEKTRVKLLSDIPSALKLFYFKPEYIQHTSIKQIKKLTIDQLKQIGKSFSAILDSFSDDAKSWTHEMWETSARNKSEELGIKAGEYFMSLRYIITGQSFSPPLFEVMQILGKQEVLSRINEFNNR